MHKIKQYQPILEVIEPLVRSLRDEVMKYFGKIEHDFKDDKTVVTHIDKFVEQKFRDVLSYKYPDIGFCGEEFGITGNKDEYWLIDPIDGTENYIRGIDGVGMMLALIKNGRPEMCVIYNPVNDMMYWAIDGEGAWREGVRIRMIDREEGRWFIEAEGSKNPKELALLTTELQAKRTNILRFYGSAHRAMQLAEGKLDGMVRWQAGGGDWDYAPSNLLIKEAGGIVTRFDIDDPLSSRSFSCVSPKVYESIGTLLQSFKKY